MKNQESAKVFVALSGGVDSSVAAALLKERGFAVTGVYMKNWADPAWPCPWKEEREDAMRVAATLRIPFRTWDFTKEYRAAVVDYMIREYASGRTPNPDVMCNREVKFGVFLRRALQEGADCIATGHYVLKHETRNLKQKTSLFALHAARDHNKDQSYFLWTLTQKQLRHALFPIGDYSKPEVRDCARRFGLCTADKKDSQGICFIGKINLADFLRHELGVRRGIIRTTAGSIVGEHDGVDLYTIGQRKGMGIGGGEPYYVAEKDAVKNTLTVVTIAEREALLRRELTAESVHWIGGQPSFPFRASARIRYRQPLQPCTVCTESSGIRVVFDAAQRAIAPGQSIVFYRGNTILGGAVIKGSVKE